MARRYPGTPYASDAAVKIDMVNDQLAGKEMNIGRYYQRANQPLAALNRYKAVIANPDYQRTSHTPEALYRLVEVNLQLGLKEGGDPQRRRPGLQLSRQPLVFRSLRPADRKRPDAGQGAARPSARAG